MGIRSGLELQADRIEQVLTMHKVPARVTGGTVTPRWIRFQVLPAVGAKISKIRNLNEEMAAALGAPNVRISRRGAAVDVEVPRDDPQPVRLLPLLRQLKSTGDEVPPTTAVLGLAEDGTPLLIRLPSPDVAHILTAGTTGSGKTALLRTIILSLALHNPPHKLALVLIDPKGHAFGVFGGLPHLARPVIRETEEVIEALRSLVHLMERRKPDDPTKVVIVIDELADLLMVGDAAVRIPLIRLTQRGREVGMHLIVATQKPTAAVLGPLVKANFPVRLVGHVMSHEDARTASGWSATGAERLMGRGDFVAVAEGRMIHFQGAFVSKEEIATVLHAQNWEPVAETPQHALIMPPTQPTPTRGEIVVTDVLPVVEEEEETDLVDEMAERLAAWDWWQEHHDERGAKTRAVRYLFGDDVEPEGYYWNKTIEAIGRWAEGNSTSISTSHAIEMPKSPNDWAEAFLEW